MRLVTCLDPQILYARACLLVGGGALMALPPCRNLAFYTRQTAVLAAPAPVWYYPGPLILGVGQGGIKSEQLRTEIALFIIISPSLGSTRPG